jgi:hypothetical protein
MRPSGFTQNTRQPETWGPRQGDWEVSSEGKYRNWTNGVTYLNQAQVDLALESHDTVQYSGYTRAASAQGTYSESRASGNEAPRRSYQSHRASINVDTIENLIMSVIGKATIQQRPDDSQRGCVRFDEPLTVNDQVGSVETVVVPYLDNSHIVVHFTIRDAHGQICDHPAEDSVTLPAEKLGRLINYFHQENI